MKTTLITQDKKILGGKPNHWLKLNKLLSTRTEDMLNQSLTVITEDTIQSTPYK